MPYRKLVLPFCFLAVFLNIHVLFAQQNDIEILRNNLVVDALEHLGFTPRTDRYIISDFDKAKEYLAEMQADGSWTDIDYDDKDNNWNPLHHLNRMLVMTINYRQPESEDYQNPALLNGLGKAIDYWYKKKPICNNWYKNDIAKQFYFNVIALLLQDKIEDKLLQNMIEDLTPAPRMTGSNRTLLSTSVFYRGVITKDVALIKAGIQGVMDPIKITTKEGVQPDFSFHQHGAFLYNGSYGFNFLRESIWLAAITHETKFSYADEQIEVLRNYYLHGMRRMIRGQILDYNVCGRRVGRPEGFQTRAIQLADQLDQLILVDPEYQKAYQQSKKSIQNNKPQPVFGNKHFWRSDYTSHQRRNYFASVRMCSERTVGMEMNMNSENKLGYWLPFGLTYMYKTGNEYLEIFPVWDWARLPGVTNPYMTIESPKTTKVSQETAFVGGVSDGQYGISAMDFAKNETEAKKAWFWFDKEWLALGTDINSTADVPIVTGINQTLLNGPIYIEQDTYDSLAQTIKSPDFVVHDRVGYVFPYKQPIRIKAETQKGNMHRIYGLGEDRLLSKKVFSLWFDHGIKPKNEGYAYIVVPDINHKKLQKYAKNIPITIIANNKHIQAMRHEKLGLTGIIFYAGGEITLEGQGAIASDQPAILLINHKKRQISLSDPTTKLASINLVMSIGNSIKQKIKVDLPKGAYAGKSVLVDF